MAGLESLICCVPTSMWQSSVCSGRQILREDLVNMGKVNCTSKACTQSGFMHPECIFELEELMIKLLKSRQFTNSGQKESFRKFDWNTKHGRTFLWKSPAYKFLSKEIKCDCGNGTLHRDIDWPPVSRKPKKIKVKAASLVKGKAAPASEKTELNFKDKTLVQYVPSVQPAFSRPFLEKSDTIPGAVFVDPKTVKRGEVIMFNGKWGQLKNLCSPMEEKPTYFKREAVVAMEHTDELIVGSEVEYQSEKKGKKHEAVMVKLVKSAEVMQQGVVSHWVPQQLAGVVTCDTRELLVTRKAFVPGGFTADIVGKLVRFKMDSTRKEARAVEVVEGQKGEIPAGHSEELFSLAELDGSELLQEAVDPESGLAGLVGALGPEEAASLATSLLPFLPRLAAHTAGWRVVAALAAAASIETQNQLAAVLQSHFLQLAESGPGAACLLSCLACLPTPLLPRLARVASAVAAQLTGPNSARLLRACLPLLLLHCDSPQLDTLLDLLCRPVEADQPPPLVSLALAGTGPVLTVLEHRAERLERVLGVFRQYRDIVIASSSGKDWIGRLSRKLNA